MKTHTRGCGQGCCNSSQDADDDLDDKLPDVLLGIAVRQADGFYIRNLRIRCRVRNDVVDRLFNCLFDKLLNELAEQFLHCIINFDC